MRFFHYLTYSCLKRLNLGKKPYLTTFNSGNQGSHIFERAYQKD